MPNYQCQVNIVKIKGPVNMFSIRVLRVNILSLMSAGSNTLECSLHPCVHAFLCVHLRFNSLKIRHTFVI